MSELLQSIAKLAETDPIRAMWMLYEVRRARVHWLHFFYTRRLIHVIKKSQTPLHCLPVFRRSSRCARLADRRWSRTMTM